MELAVLEKYHFMTSKGSSFELVWEQKSIHGREEPKGLRAAPAPYNAQKSLAVCYTAKTDIKLFAHDGAQLASVNSAGMTSFYLTVDT